MFCDSVPVLIIIVGMLWIDRPVQYGDAFKSKLFDILVMDSFLHVMFVITVVSG